MTLLRDDSLLMTEFTSSVPLELCTDYSLHIKPLWAATDLYEKVEEFCKTTCYKCLGKGQNKCKISTQNFQICKVKLDSPDHNS